MVKDIVAPLFERTALALRRDLTLGTLMDRLATIHGDRRLVEEDGGLRLTYNQAAKRVRRWAGGVAARTTPGDVVVVATASGYEQVLLCLAVARAGAVPAPAHPTLTKAELAHVVDDSGASLVLRRAGDVDGSEPLRTAVDADADDVGALFYTSGTTGKPKGVELTNRSLVGQLVSALMWPAGLRRDEAVMALPTAHIMGFVSVLGLAAAGIPVYFLPRFRAAAVLDAIESRRATMFIGVPAMYRMLLDAGAEQRDLGSVRVWLSGADAMPAELAATFKKLGATATLPLVGSVGQAAFAEGYGMVESGGGVAAKLSPPGLGLGLGDGMGVALPGYRFKVVDEGGTEVHQGAVGELLIKGPGVLKGYRGDPGATAGALTPDGWLRTGDLVRKGPMGTVLFAGRQKDVIISGGYSVYAVEVEQALEEHPDVVEAAVVPLPDERKGEVPVAAFRCRDGAALDLRRAEVVGGGAAQPVQGADPLPRGRRAAPHLDQQGQAPRGRVPLPLAVTSGGPAAGRHDRPSGAGSAGGVAPGDHHRGAGAGGGRGPAGGGVEVDREVAVLVDGGRVLGGAAPVGGQGQGAVAPGVEAVLGGRPLPGAGAGPAGRLGGERVPAGAVARSQVLDDDVAVVGRRGVGDQEGAPLGDLPGPAPGRPGLEGLVAETNLRRVLVAVEHRRRPQPAEHHDQRRAGHQEGPAGVVRRGGDGHRRQYPRPGRPDPSRRRNPAPRIAPFSGHGARVHAPVVPRNEVVRLSAASEGDPMIARRGASLPGRRGQAGSRRARPGGKVIARALRDAGFEVIYTGLFQTPEQVAEAVLQEDADAVGLSVLSGAHLTLFPKVVEALAERGLDDVLVFGGGIIPDADIPALKEKGVAEVFTPGTPMSSITSWLADALDTREPAGH